MFDRNEVGSRYRVLGFINILLLCLVAVLANKPESNIERQLKTIDYLFSQYDGTSESYKTSKGKATKYKSKCSSSSWIVLYSDISITQVNIKLKHALEWCVIVIPTKESLISIENSDSSNVLVLNKQMEDDLKYQYSDLYSLLTEIHTSRKNIGYVLALSQGAKLIYDSDDDILHMPKSTFYLPGESTAKVAKVANMSDLTINFSGQNYELLEPTLVDIDSNSLHKSNVSNHISVCNEVFNVYRLMSSGGSTWQRGFPVSCVKSHSRKEFVKRIKKVNSDSIGIVQNINNHHPDVDTVSKINSKNKIILNISYDDL